MNIPPPAKTIPELLRMRAEQFGDRKFFICDTDILTFAAAEERSRRLAKALLALGARKGTRIGLIYPSAVDFAVCFFAATRIGAVAIPFSTLSTPDELRWLLANSDTEILLATSSYRTRNFVDIIKAAVPGLDFAAAPPLRAIETPSLQYVFIDGETTVSGAWSLDGLLAHADYIGDAFLRAVEYAATAADRAVIVYTSGSTSAPKGVIHNHGSLLAHLRHLNQIRDFRPDDALFSNAPFFWIGGLAYCLIGALEAGGRVVYSNSQSSSDTLDLIERERPTLVTGFAQSVVHLMKDPSYAKRDFSSVRRGNMPAIMAYDVRPKDPELRHNKLGSTETGSVYLTDAFEGDLPEHLRGSFGKPTPGFEVKIVDPETSREVSAGTVGEIRVRGPYMMEGYVGRQRHEVFDADGWYRTGDLATRDAEGYVFYKGRRGDMIKTSGANVSPREVEEVMAAITGSAAHVLGIDDPERGQMVVAAVVADDTQGLDEAALRERLKAKLSSYKIPRRILFLKQAQVPMMSTGKLDKRMLAEMFRAG